MERKKRLISFLEEATDDENTPSPSGGENTDGQEEQMSPEDAEKQFLQQKVKEFQQKKEQEEQYLQNKIKEIEDRDAKIRSKLGRLLATPEEIEELDKEREEEEKREEESKIDHEDGEFDESVKSNSRKSLIDKIKKQGFEHTSKNVWVNKSSGKKGKITPENTWEPIEEEIPEETPEISDQTPKFTAKRKAQLDKEAQEIVDKKKEERKKEKEKIHKEKIKELQKSKISQKKDVTVSKEKRKIYPSGAKAEQALVDAINGKSKANELLLELIQDWQKRGIIPKGATADAVGSSGKYELSKDWEGGSKIPKTDILIRDKNGKIINRVSVKNGSAQLMSGLKGETRSVLKTAAKEAHLEEDTEFQHLINKVNNFVQGKSFSGLDFGQVHTPEAEKIRKFHKNASKFLVEYVNNNPKFLKSIIKEAMTGNHKFGKKSEATADTLLYLDPKGDLKKCCMVKITDRLVTKIAKECSLNFSIKSVNKKSSSAMRIQTPELNAGVSLYKIGSYLTEEIEEMINKDNFFDMFDIEIIPDLPDNDELSEILKEEEKDQKPNKKLQEHFETYELVEDD